MKSFLLSLIIGVIGVPVIAGTQYYRLTYRDDPATSIVIGWCDNGTSTNAMVYYDTTDHGTDYAAYSLNKSIDRTVNYKGQNHRFARLSGLSPNTVYYFVIRDQEGPSARMYFKTLPDNPEIPIMYISGGDSRTGIFTEFEYSQCRPRRQDANRLVAKVRADFIAFSGDYVYLSYLNSSWNDWFTDWQLSVSPDGRLTPIVPTYGNHELTDDIYNMFDVPDNNTYYALTFGGKLFRLYTLNTEILCDATQKSWLLNDLQLYTGNATEPYWKMAQYHAPFAPHAGYTTDTVMINCWVNMFQTYKVKLCSEAHAHIIKWTWPIVTSSAAGNDQGFVRNDANGIVYIGEGSWGAPMRDLYTYYSAEAAYNWTRNQEQMPGFQLVCVSKESIEIRVAKLDNAANVSQVSMGEPPCTLPSNLTLWNPSNGPVVIINNPVSEIAAKESFKNDKMARVWPNPAKDKINIEIKSNKRDVQVEVYDAYGRQVCVSVLKNESAQIDLSKESSGMYDVFIRDGQRVESHKVSLVK